MMNIESKGDSDDHDKYGNENKIEKNFKYHNRDYIEKCHENHSENYFWKNCVLVLSGRQLSQNFFFMNLKEFDYLSW